MSNTHGGNPVCAAAALAHLQVLEDERLVEAAARTGAAVMDRPRGLQRDYSQSIREVQGVGLFISVHFRRPYTDEPAVESAEKYTSSDGYLDKLCMELVGLDSSCCRSPTRDVRVKFREQARKMLLACGTPIVVSG